jgi:hypothetical protein
METSNRHVPPKGGVYPCFTPTAIDAHHEEKYMYATGDLIGLGKITNLNC